MADITEDQIRELAYELWQRDGGQDGKDDDYWHAAKKLLADEGDEVAGDDPGLVPPVLPIPPAGLK